jgi:hypothetical protein
MVHDAGAMTADAHPAPHRERVALAALVFPVLAPPLAWSLHLVVNFAFSSHACYPDGEPLSAPPTRFDWLWSLLIAVDFVSMAVGLVAAIVAYRSWILSALERAETGRPLMEAGEGCTRFLAIWGVLIGAGFPIATAFDFVGLWVLPICG